jgi:hypothetical protein
MKELSIEQKAKAYDETIEKLRNFYRDYDTISRLINVKEELANLIPELKESEDEGIRKALVELVHDTTGDSLWVDYNVHKEDALAWLEKQGEHAKFRDSIQVCDKVTRNEDGVLVNLSQLDRVAKKQDEKKLYVNDNAKEMFIKALERVEEQNNKGYKLTDCDKNSWWEDFKTYTSCIIEQKPSWSEEDTEHLNSICATLKEKANERPFDMPSYWDKQIDWLKSLKDRVQPKQEWSEEDKNMLQSILDEYKSMPTEKRNWLKSLKERYTWKPSEEQMDAIKDAIDYLGENTKIVRKHLILLYGQLKKLKEG